MRAVIREAHTAGLDLPHAKKMEWHRKESGVALLTFQTVTVATLVS